MEIMTAEPKDLNRIMEIIAQAKEYFKVCGIGQWQISGPNEQEITSAIEKGEVYIFCEGAEIIGFASMSLTCETAGGSYAVINRIAVDERFKNKGAAAEFINFAGELCEKNSIAMIKTKTHADNLAMRRMLKKSGFMHSLAKTADNAEILMSYEKEIKVKNKEK